MSLKTFKPYTKSTRGTVLVDKTGLWKGKPFKKLVQQKNAMKGRNNMVTLHQEIELVVTNKCIDKLIFIGKNLTCLLLLKELNMTQIDHVT